ncbi:hypothetical protein VNO80_13774 [Phaseolus coccineus]|uniref:RALF-like protein n=1 Tax=Phaseolus coccineus TaxID=3886 RepID=A0AAN9N6V8_PHACN
MIKGLSLVLLILLIHHNLVNATNCVTEDCVIGNDLESEFSFGFHTSRMLYDVSLSVQGYTGNRNYQAVNCPKAQAYRSCLPSQNGGGPNKNCDETTRNC